MQSRFPHRWFPLAAACLLAFSTTPAHAQAPGLTDQEALGKLAAYDVTWNEPGSSSLDSMPLGNGDIAANVWVEKDGDLMLYVAKSDAWAEDQQASDGLLKLGRIRVHLSPEPFRGGSAFRQQLRLQDGAITINAGPPGAATQIRVWVDANHPVLRIEIRGDQPVGARVVFESLRTPAELKKRPPEGYTRQNGKLHADTLFPGPDKSIAWAYRRGQAGDRAGGATFGAFVQGSGMRTVDRASLETIAPAKDCVISLVAATSSDDAAWLARVQQTALEIARVPLGTAWQAHQQWWQQFWQRSWIFVEGDSGAQDVTRAYILQRS